MVLLRDVEVSAQRGQYGVARNVVHMLGEESVFNP